MTFVTKDSGERRGFPTGAVRDKAEGKGRYDLLPFAALDAVTRRMVQCKFGTEPSRGYQLGMMLKATSEAASGNRDGFLRAVIYAMLIIERDEIGYNREYEYQGGVDFCWHKLPREAIDRYAKLLERGAVKYEARNWEKGMPLSVYADSMARHAWQVQAGMTDEDHLAAVIFNGCAAIHFMEIGRTELDDLPNSERVEDYNTDYYIVESPIQKGAWRLYYQDIHLSSRGSLEGAVEALCHRINTEGGQQ